jgi:hypothetical protein
MCARICRAPSAQFNPIESGAACATEFQNASGVWPERSRHAYAARLHDFGDRENGGLGVERVEDGLDEQRIDAAVKEAVHLFGVSDAQLVEGDSAKAGIQNVRRD